MGKVFEYVLNKLADMLSLESALVPASAWTGFKGTLTTLTLFTSQLDTEIISITVKELFQNSSYIQRKVQKNIPLQWPGLPEGITYFT